MIAYKSLNITLTQCLVKIRLHNVLLILSLLVSFVFLAAATAAAATAPCCCITFAALLPLGLLLFLQFMGQTVAVF